MTIDELKLHSYRNYASLNLTLSPGVNILTGLNAQGKTNVLESVYLLATGRSHRTPRDSELIMAGEPHARVSALLVRRDGRMRVELALNRDARKRAFIDGAPLPRIGELLGNLNAVLFAPEDLKLVKESPAHRRRFLDMELSQLHRGYYLYLQRYQRALEQRGALLRGFTSGRVREDGHLQVWDDQLCEAGARIIRVRAEFLLELGMIVDEIHRDIAGEPLNMEYLPSVAPCGELEAALGQALRENRARDIARGSTSVGPHRDDFSLLMSGGEELRVFGSQGQQRTGALCLKLAQKRLIMEKTGDVPLLLLDDVMSELDEKRRSALISHIEGAQTLITCTSAEPLGGIAEGAKLLKVCAGTIEEGAGWHVY